MIITGQLMAKVTLYYVGLNMAIWTKNKAIKSYLQLFYIKHDLKDLFAI